MPRRANDRQQTSGNAHPPVASRPPKPSSHKPPAVTSKPAAPPSRPASGSKKAPPAKVAPSNPSKVAPSKALPPKAAPSKAAPPNPPKASSHKPSAATSKPAAPPSRPASGSKKAPPGKAAPSKAALSKAPTNAPAKPPVSHSSASTPQPTAASSRPSAGAGAHPRPEDGALDSKFLAEQEQLLLGERQTYTEQAEQLKAEADSLVEDMEPGDVQFDEESGEGGTVTVDRERDLALSAQAQAAIEEIDHALVKIKAGTYGYCERCHSPIPRTRLRALPYARLCVPCKSGGLSRR